MSTCAHCGHPRSLHDDEPGDVVRSACWYQADEPGAWFCACQAFEEAGDERRNDAPEGA